MNNDIFGELYALMLVELASHTNMFNALNESIKNKRIEFLLRTMEQLKNGRKMEAFDGYNLNLDFRLPITIRTYITGHLESNLESGGFDFVLNKPIKYGDGDEIVLESFAMNESILRKILISKGRDGTDFFNWDGVGL